MSLSTQIPYEKKFFDLITALDVIEHLDGDIDSLEVILTHPTLNGKAVIADPTYISLWSPFDELNEHKPKYRLTEHLPYCVSILAVVRK